MRKQIVRITTEDTKQTYEFPGDNIPQLWEVELSINSVNNDGWINKKSKTTEAKIYLERKTLVNAKLLPKASDGTEKQIQQTNTPEDLILELLAHLGFYPEQ